MRSKAASILLLTVALSFAFVAIDRHATPVHAWWETGHTIVASRAARLLPQPWSNFFGYYELIVNETAVAPDTIYRSLDPNEDPRHFIDLEVWSPNKPSAGTLPFAVEQYTAEMSQAIKSRDWNQMFIASGRVAHYVADIHQPYHSTVNYDPRNKAGAGLHGVLDGSMEAHLTEFTLVSPNDISRLQPVENLTAFMFYIAWQSHSFLPTINHTLIDEGKSWSPELTKIIENRTNTAIVSLARVWYTAIVNAGQQPPPVSSPNRLQIAIQSPPQQVPPEKALIVSFTVSDSLGIRTILKPKAKIGDIQVDAYNNQGLETPFGRYVAVLQPDTLRRFAGSSLTLNLVAEQIGYESATTQLQIQISQTQTTTTTPQPSFTAEISNIILMAVAVAILGVALRLALRRVVKAR